MKNNLVMVAGLRVRSNEKGLYSLNDIHRASGSKPKNTPARWLERKGTQDLIDSALKRLNNEKSASQKWEGILEVNNGGADHGVYAHELLVVSYAGWIDSDFQIEVNYTFLETIKERAAALEKENEALSDFRDGFYRMELANGMLAKDYSKLDQDTIKGIKMVIRTLKYKKELSIYDLISMPLIQPKAADRAFEYVLRNVVTCLNPGDPRERQVFIAKQ